MAEHADATDGQLKDEAAFGVDNDPDGEATAGRAGSRAGKAVVLGTVAAVVAAALVGWAGYRANDTRQLQMTRAELVETARQSAVNLTTIDYTTVDADIQRILDSSTGTFRDDFQQRSGPFADVVKQAKSTSEGTVTEAGLESQDGDQAQVLVTVSVQTSNDGAHEQQPREWRMRISVQKADGGTKVADVQFVP